MSLDRAYYNYQRPIIDIFIFESEVQRPYLDVPGLSDISDVVMMCVQCVPELPE